MTEDEMIGWHHKLNGHALELTPGDSERQGSLLCCSPWGCKESDTTEYCTELKHQVSKVLELQLQHQSSQ